MDRTRTMPRICFMVTAALTLAGVILRSVCQLTQFDAAVGYFNEGILSTRSNALYFAAVLLITVGACFIPKSSLPTELRMRLRLPVALLVGLSLAAFTVASFVLYFPAITSEDPRVTAITPAPIVLGLPASLYFIISGKRDGRYPDGLSAAGFLPILWCVAAVAETYSDKFTTMNSPVKLGLQMGFLGFMLLLLAELRFRLGKAMPRAAVAFFGIGSFLCLVGSVPVLLGTGARILDNKFHMLYAIVLLCAGLYGLYTLFCFTFFPARHPDGGHHDGGHHDGTGEAVAPDETADPSN